MSAKYHLSITFRQHWPRNSCMVSLRQLSFLFGYYFLSNTASKLSASIIIYNYYWQSTTMEAEYHSID